MKDPCEEEKFGGPKQKPELPEEMAEEEINARQVRRDHTRMLTAIQIAACAAVLAAAVFLRLNGGDLYRSVRDWYVSSVNDSIVPEEQSENVKRTVVGLWSSLASSRGNAAALFSSSAASGSSSSAVSRAGKNGGSVSEGKAGTSPAPPKSSSAASRPAGSRAASSKAAAAASVITVP